MLARLRALDILKQEVGVHEEGANNLGRRVREYQRADTLPGEGYAWCQSLQNWGWVKATGKLLADGTPSVGFFVSYARARGWIVDRPFKGDHVAFHFNSDTWPDHVGVIEKVLRLGPTWVLQTIEGNTGPFGAVSDPGTGRDGVYRKRRVVHKSKVVFVRVPGTVPDPKVSKPDPLKRPASAPRIIPLWAWRLMKWHDSGKKGKRPNAPLRTKPWYWLWRAWKLRLRKKAAKPPLT